MARPKKYSIFLTDEQLGELKSIIHKKQIPKTVRNRCQIIIDLDEAHGKSLTHEQSAKINGVCMATISNTVKLYHNKGIKGITSLGHDINIDNTKCKLEKDNKNKTFIIEIKCMSTPEGQQKWMLRLLEEQAKIILDTSVGKMS